MRVVATEDRLFSPVKLRLLARVSTRKVSATQSRIWFITGSVDLQSTSLSPFFSRETMKRGSRVCCTCRATQNTSIPSHDTNNYPFSAQISTQEQARASVLFLTHTTVTVISQSIRKATRSKYGRFPYLPTVPHSAGLSRKKQWRPAVPHQSLRASLSRVRPTLRVTACAGSSYSSLRMRTMWRDLTFVLLPLWTIAAIKIGESNE